MCLWKTKDINSLPANQHNFLELASPFSEIVELIEETRRLEEEADEEEEESGDEEDGDEESGGEEAGVEKEDEEDEKDGDGDGVSEREAEARVKVKCTLEKPSDASETSEKEISKVSVA